MVRWRCGRATDRAARGDCSPKPFVLLNHLTEPSAMPRAPSGNDERTTREKEESISNGDECRLMMTGLQWGALASART